MANRLLVHATLMKGRGNHHLMTGATHLEDVTFNGKHAEVYDVTDDHLKKLDIFESMFGWQRVYNEEHKASVYIFAPEYLSWDLPGGAPIYD